MLKASEILGLSKDEIDITLCDVLGDSGPLMHDFRVALTSLD